MTRQEFINNVTTWSELLSFCYDYDCDVCADIISHDSLAENIADDFNSYGYEYPWTDIRRWLNNIDDSARYYYRSGSFEYESVDNNGTFEEYKDEVLSWGDDMYIFDDEDEDEDEDEESFIDSDVFDDSLPDNDCSVEEFLGLCSPTTKS